MSCGASCRLSISLATGCELEKKTRTSKISTYRSDLHIWCADVTVHYLRGASSPGCACAGHVGSSSRPLKGVAAPISAASGELAQPSYPRLRVDAFWGKHLLCYHNVIYPIITLLVLRPHVLTETVIREILVGMHQISDRITSKLDGYYSSSFSWCVPNCTSA